MNESIKLIVGIVLLAVAIALVLIPIAGIGALIIYLIILLAISIRIIQQYQTGVVFSLGKLDRVLQPGFNLIFPFVEAARIVDMRILTVDIPRQQAITKDNIPVTINGVLYFKVQDPVKAIIAVQDYLFAVSQYAQTALRDVIGQLTLDDVLAEREQIGKRIEEIVEKESRQWGIEVTSIKMQDIDMPEDLKRLMSRQASSEREKRATIIKAEGDRIAAENLAKAASIMNETPGAMQLRTLQTIDGLGPTPSNTVIVGIPIEFLDAVRAFAEAQKKLAKRDRN